MPQLISGASDHTNVPMRRKAATPNARRTKPPKPRRLVLRVTLRHIEPPIWREINVPDSYSLLQLHRCIQLVFSWLDYHLFEFRVGARRFEAADSEADGADAARMRLCDLDLSAQSTFLYVYDMGDYWEHEISVAAIMDVPASGEPDPLAYLVGGARAAPPEDVGGPSGYEEAIAAFARRSPEDEETLAWLGSDFQPELFDQRAGNHALVLATAWSAI